MSPVELDAQLTRAALEVRASWLTPLLVLLSAWPVKGPLLAGLATAQPGPLRRRLAVAGVVAAAALLGSLASTVVKAVVGRVRPPAELGLDALVALPDTSSFPSGHATTAAAAATALALMVPRWRALAVALAVLVGASRVLLGVHFVADVLAGFALGAAMGTLAVLVGRRVIARYGSGERGVLERRAGEALPDPPAPAAQAAPGASRGPRDASSDAI